MADTEAAPSVVTIESAPAFGAGRALRRGTRVLPEHARTHNRSLLLQTLFHGGAMSRADLARHSGLTRVTVSDLIAELIADGYVAERGVRAASGPGKPAILVDLDRTGHQIVGIDLSGPDEFIGAVLTLDGEIVERRRLARPAAADGDAAVEAVVTLANDLLTAATAPVLGVGVGTPGVVNPAGTVLSAPNVGWSLLPLQRILEERLGVPVLVANDANAAVLAEYTYGRGGDDLMLIKVGRGVGAALLTGGRLLLGSHFAAGEFGHVTVGTDGGPRCACGKDGCLEAWLSVPSLGTRLAAAAPAAREGVLRDAGERLGIAVAPIVGALDLPEIVLSGPSELLDGPLARATVETLRTRTLAEFHDGVRVRMTEQGQDIVLRGAAVVVLSGQLGVS